MRLTKIYTKIGDKGKTMLADGSKVAKNSDRIDCYGHVDELNSFAGYLQDLIAEEERLVDLAPFLKRIQNELFDVGGELATPLKILDTSRQQVVSTATVQRLEDEIDGFNEHLAPLENFVLPGGHRANSIAHICRTVCRRAERATVKLADTEEVRDEPRVYLNRLSDWFFVLSREICRRLDIAEQTWDQKGK